MKKAFLTTLLILSVFLSLSAQNDVLPNLMTKGTNMGSLGIGLPAIGSGYSMTIPPISAFYEVGILDFGRPGSVAVGAHAGFWGYRYKTTIGDYNATYRYFNTLVGVRGTYHFTILENWEVYGGAVLGLKLESNRHKDNIGTVASNTYVRFGWQALGGTRYMFTPYLGAFVEAGYGFTIATIGVSYRF